MMFAMENRSVRIINLLPAIVLGFGLFIFWGAVVKLADPLLLISLAIIIAAALNPAVVWANKRLRLPRGVAAGIILFLVLGGAGLLLWSLIPALVSQMSNLVSSIPASVAQAQQLLVDLSSKYPFLKSASDSLQQTDLSKQVQSALSVVPKTLLGALGATTGLLNGLLLGSLLLIMGFTVLVQPEPLIRGGLAAIPVQYRDEVGRAMARIGTQLGAWLNATFITSVGMGVLVGFALWVLGFFGVHVQSILLFAVIAGVTNVIPVIGPLFGLIPPVLASLSPVPSHALVVGIVVLAVQQVIAAIGPILLSRSLALHQASLLAGVLIFSGLFGVTGAFLAVPFLVIIKALYEEIYLPVVGAGKVTDQEVSSFLHGEVIETPEQA